VDAGALAWRLARLDGNVQLVDPPPPQQSLG